MIAHMPSKQQNTFKQLHYLVLDEVDRLVQPPSRYINLDSKAEREKAAKDPIERIVDFLTRLHFPSLPKIPAKGADRSSSCSSSYNSHTPESAGKGGSKYDRAPDPGSGVRGALCDVLQVVGASATVGRPLRREMARLFSSTEGLYGGAFPVLRPVDTQAIALRKARPVHPREDHDAAAHEGSVRLVGIPKSINHVVLLDSSEERASLAAKLGLIKAAWQQSSMQRGIIFVPLAEDVDRAVAILSCWRLGEVRSLLSTLGLSHTFLDASRVRPGSSLGLAAGQTEAALRVLYVAPCSGTRGLHVQELDAVFVTQPPRSMDDYLHLAGRTGRMHAQAGSGREQGTRQGTVFTVASQEGWKRLVSWQTALDIQFLLKMC
jgi:hypothetical protein